MAAQDLLHKYSNIRTKAFVQRRANAVANAMANVGHTSVKRHECTAMALARSVTRKLRCGIESLPAWSFLH